MSHIYLIGRPNVGKSFLFNRLSGGLQKVANFSGATVDKKTISLDEELNLTDLPGIYSLKARTQDERISLQALENTAPDDLVCLVVEATKLKGQLSLILDTVHWAHKKMRPLVVCINMADESEGLGIKIDSDQLAKILNVPIFLVSAKTSSGINKLKNFIKNKQWEAPAADLTLSPQEYMQEISSSVISGPYEKALWLPKKVDQFLLSPVLGPAFFLFVTFVIFQSIFTWATPLMDIVESILSSLGTLASANFSNSFLKSFTENAIFAGFGSFLVFTPQIFVLTFIVGILEKSGYMARATTLCHKPFSYFGLTGKSFIPYMTGHACAIPAIYSARTIENPWVKQLTLMTIPLTVCSARIPIYALLIRLLVPEQTFFFGLLGFQGLAFFGMYFFGIFMALVVSTVIDRIARKKASDQKVFGSSSFIMELPPYRFPPLLETFKRALKTTWRFITGAGPIIFTVNAVIWALSYFPNGDGHFEQSYMAQIGQFLEPVFLPLGLNWVHGVAILTSFLAREVFVSTLGLLYGFKTEDLDQLVEELPMQDLTLASGLGLLVFFAVALQCASTVGVLLKETQKKSWVYGILVGYLVLAYIMAFITYQGLKLFVR